jgi:hypothetical protein
MIVNTINHIDSDDEARVAGPPDKFKHRVVMYLAMRVMR